MIDLNLDKNKIKKITGSAHFYQRADERFGLSDVEALNWAKHIIRNKDIEISNGTYGTYRIKLKQVVLAYNKEKNELETCYNKSQDSWEVNLIRGLRELPYDMKTKVEKTLINSLQSHMRMLLGKQVKKSQELTKLLDTGSRTTRPDVLKEKYFSVCSQISDMEGDINEFNQVLKTIKNKDNLEQVIHDAEEK